MDQIKIMEKTSRVRAARTHAKKVPMPEGKRLPVTEAEMPVKEWTASQNNVADGFFSTSRNDAVNRGKRADAKMMKSLERVCWHCGATYNPPLFSGEGKFFCSVTCSNKHVFSEKQQVQLQQNYGKEWQEMAAAGVFEDRQDIRSSRVERW